MANTRDFLLNIEKGTADADLVLNNPDEKSTNWLNNIYLSLMVEKGSDWFNSEFGSELHKLKRAKNTALTEQLGKSYCEEALEWMVEFGRASHIIVNTERVFPPNVIDDLFILKIQIIVFQTDGVEVTFVVYKEVV